MSLFGHCLTASVDVMPLYFRSLCLSVCFIRTGLTVYLSINPVSMCPKLGQLVLSFTEPVCLSTISLPDLLSVCLSTLSLPDLLSVYKCTVSMCLKWGYFVIVFMFLYRYLVLCHCTGGHCLGCLSTVNLRAGVCHPCVETELTATKKLATDGD